MIARDQRERQSLHDALRVLNEDRNVLMTLAVVASAHKAESVRNDLADYLVPVEANVSWHRKAAGGLIGFVKLDDCESSTCFQCPREACPHVRGLSAMM